MKKPFRAAFAGLLPAMITLGVCLSAKPRAVPRPRVLPDPRAAEKLKDFAALGPIDTHAHVVKIDARFWAMFDRLNLHIVDICVASDDPPYFKDVARKIEAVRAVVHSSGGRAAFCTTFDPYKFNKPGFTQDASRRLNRNFDQGAVAVKIWKNVGMEVKNAAGKFVMPDDAALQPLYQDIAAHHKTLIAHLAEPTSCWRPQDPSSPDYTYYRDHPKWYMYRHPDHPSKETILAARDHLLAMNPDLRVVGAHLGSMELDLDKLAQRFDRYPNFAVDTAARIVYLALQPRDKVRNFLIKYQDRVVYGTDLEFRPNQSADEAVKDWEETYARDWKFFSTDQPMEYEGKRTQGLKLPHPVLKKLFHDNAVHWIPGITPNP
jgi:predicted TIM-barrel fold metal-dependent hydrolase